MIGGGGLGDLAVRYGYQRYQTEVMAVTVILLLVLVQVLQMRRRPPGASQLLPQVSQPRTRATAYPTDPPHHPT